VLLQGLQRTSPTNGFAPLFSKVDKVVLLQGLQRASPTNSLAPPFPKVDKGG
jgi:hypothetical protein